MCVLHKVLNVWCHKISAGQHYDKYAKTEDGKAEGFRNVGLCMW